MEKAFQEAITRGGGYFSGKTISVGRLLQLGGILVFEVRNDGGCMRAVIAVVDASGV